MENSEEKALEVYEEQLENGVVAIIPTNIFGSASMFWCSIDLANAGFEEKAIIANAMANPTYKLDAVANTKICLAQNILAHGIQLRSQQTGNLEDAVRIVIMLANGETVAGVSTGMRGSLTNIINIMGKPPWVPALPIFFEKVPTRSGNSTYNAKVAIKSPLPKVGEVETPKK